MKWWHWLILELLIIFGVIAWIYFFPSESEGDFAKGMIGFVLFYAIEECKEINRRKTMDYKKGMTCGKCLKYEFCPVANHNSNHKACMKITTEENYTVEQNAGENRIEGGVVSISGSVEKPELKETLKTYNGCGNWDNDFHTCRVYLQHEELQMYIDQLTKAKKIIKKFSEFVNNDVEYDPEHPQEYTDLWNELCEQAEQFLKDSEVEK